MIIVHVDDLLISSNLTDLVLLKNVLSQFKTGPIFEMYRDKKLEYLGLELEQNSKGHIRMHQMKYINDLQVITIEDVIRNKTWMITKERWKTLTKQLVGSLIWLGQTRFGVAAVTTVIATSMTTAATDIDKALVILKLYNKTVKSLRTNKDVIWYRPLWKGSTPTVEQLLHCCSLFTFTDAGFACLEGSFSTQALVIGYGSARKKNHGGSAMLSVMVSG